MERLAIGRDPPAGDAGDVDRPQPPREVRGQRNLDRRLAGVDGDEAAARNAERYV